MVVGGKVKVVDGKCGGGKVGEGYFGGVDGKIEYDGF